MKPFRILQVVTIMNRGGLETMLMNYYRKLNRSNIQFDFMVHREEEGHYDAEISKLGGKIYRMPKIMPGHYRKYFKSLENFFKDHTEYHVVHSHINENSSFVLHAAKEAGISCRIAHSHLSDLGIDLKLPFRLYARYKLKNNPSDYFACSEKAGQWLFGKRRIDRYGITILNNAVNASEFKYNQTIRTKIRKELGIGQDDLVIGHIGRFNKQKNHKFLIDIFFALQKENPNSKLVLVGNGDLRQAIEKKIMTLGLAPKTSFLGLRDDIPQLMQAFDVFLFPSLFEGLPVVLIEAQAAGVPCIVSDTITREADVTDRIDFISLNLSPREWASRILTSSYEHIDSLKLIKKRGYDTETMADWLGNYYAKHYTSATSIGEII